MQRISDISATAAGEGFGNLTGVKTLYIREVWRFLRVWNQTLIAPMVTALLMLAIFSLAVGGRIDPLTLRGSTSGQVAFSAFMASGLVMMSIVQNAFANTSSSLILSKIQGSIIDILMPPLSAAEVVAAYVLGAITRGTLVGLVVYAAMAVFTDIGLHSLPLALFYTVFSSMLLALIGLCCGIWAQTFDQMSAITNYVITPLAFLSGTFYSIHRLPPFWQDVARVDPFFYMIDGFRYAVTGYSDGSITLGITILLAANVVMTVVSVALFRSGWRLKS